MDDDYPIDVGVLRNLIPKIATVPKPKSRRLRPKEISDSVSKSSTATPSRGAVTTTQTSSLQNGTMIISPSHEFDHADALNLVKSARAAGLSLPENANYIFLAPPSRPATAAVSGVPDATVSSPVAEPTTARLRDRKRPPTSTKKFMTKVFSTASATKAENTAVAMSRSISQSSDSPVSRKRPSTDDSSEKSSPQAGATADEPEYQIEKILKKRVSHGNRVRYLVKWVGHTDLTWEPRCNFASDNDAWLAFKREQAEKRASGLKSGRSHKARSESGDQDTSVEAEEGGTDDDRDSRVKISEDGSGASSSRETRDAVEKEDETMVSEVVVEVSASSSAVAKEGPYGSSSSSEKSLTDAVADATSDLSITDLEKDLESAEPPKRPHTVTTTLWHPETATALNTGPRSSSAKGPKQPTPSPPLRKPSAASSQSPTVSPTPLRNIAPLPRENVVQMTQMKHGDMVIYLPHNFANSPTVSPAAARPATPAVTVRPSSAESRPTASSPEILAPRSRPIATRPAAPSLAGFSVPRPVAPTFSSATSLNGPRVQQFRPPAPTASTSRPVQPIMAASPTRTLFPSANRFPQFSTQRMAVYTPTSGFTTVSTSSPAPPRPPATAVPRFDSMIRTVTLPSGVSATIVRQTKEIGTNTALSLVTAQTLTTHAGIGKSGLDVGALVVNIAGFKPRDVAVTCLDDVAFLVTYANRDSEFVDYQECIRRIPHEVAEFLFKNKINAVDTPPLRILT